MSAFTDALGIWGNAAVFLVAAATILVAGSKLERIAERIGRVTKLGEVFAGMVLLAVSTSLPEIATSATAALHGNVALAVSNLLGGVIIQTMVLAVADAGGKPSALTSKAPSVGLLLQGVGLILMLAMTAMAAGVEAHWSDQRWIAIAGPSAIVAVYLIMQYVAMKSGSTPRWTPTKNESEGKRSTDAALDEEESATDGDSLRKLIALYAVGSAFVCVGGYMVVVTIEHIAQATGASQSFLGFTLVAFATSLPELSTTLSASRRGHGVTAASNIFGSNSFDVALLLLVALLTDGALLAEALIESVFAASLGVVMTAVYLVGLLERRDRTILRMGWDSALVLVLGFLGVWTMFALGA